VRTRRRKLRTLGISETNARHGRPRARDTGASLDPESSPSPCPTATGPTSACRDSAAPTAASGTRREPPDADPHVRWCGRRRGEPGAYPVSGDIAARGPSPVAGFTPTPAVSSTTSKLLLLCSQVRESGLTEELTGASAAPKCCIAWAEGQPLPLRRRSSSRSNPVLTPGPVDVSAMPGEAAVSALRTRPLLGVVPIDSQHRGRGPRPRSS
jgi:hypothetical protein